MGTLDNIVDEYAAIQRNLAAWQARSAELDAKLEQALSRSLSPSGEAMPTADLPGWEWIYGEDFLRPAPLGQFDAVYADTIPTYPETYFDTSRNAGRPATTQGQYNTRRVVSVQNSVLEKWLHTEGVRPMVAALVPKLPTDIPSSKWSYRLGGRQSIRARVLAPAPGFKVAWLLWPISDSRLFDGEIDGPEQGFQDLSHCSFFVHHAPSTPAPEQYGSNMALDLTRWHTFTREWWPGKRVVQSVDGVVIQNHVERIPDTPMRWVIQTETAVSATPPNPLVQTVVQIDWIAAWGLSPA